MIVWIASRDYYSEYSVIGVYSSREKAILLGHEQTIKEWQDGDYLCDFINMPGLNETRRLEQFYLDDIKGDESE